MRAEGIKRYEIIGSKKLLLLGSQDEMAVDVKSKEAGVDADQDAAGCRSGRERSLM